MGSSFGTLFRIHTFGESHGGGVGVIVDGCPPRLDLDLAAIQADLDRRKPGQSKITTPRKEWRLGVKLLQALQNQGGALRLPHGCCMAGGTNLGVMAH